MQQKSEAHVLGFASHQSSLGTAIDGNRNSPPLKEATFQP